MLHELSLDICLSDHNLQVIHSHIWDYPCKIQYMSMYNPIHVHWSYHWYNDKIHLMMNHLMTFIAFSSLFPTDFKGFFNHKIIFLELVHSFLRRSSWNSRYTTSEIIRLASQLPNGCVSGVLFYRIFLKYRFNFLWLMF